MYTRWYSQSVQAEPLFRKLRKGCQGFDVQFDNVTAWVGGVVGIIAALYLTLVFVVISAGNEDNPNRKKPNNPNGMAVVAGIGFALCAVGGCATWLIISGGNRRKRKRVLAFDDAINKYDIQSCGKELLEGDYGIPLFHTVELEECPGKRLWAWLCGKWKDDEFAWLQGGHLVDPLLRTLGDNEVLNLGLRVLGGRQASRVNRLRQAGFDVVVFSEELNLPDILLGHHQIFETSYSRKAVQEYAQPLPGIPASFTIWGATSDQRGTSGVYGALADLVNSRHCLIQVIGGRVVVFLNCFIGWESELVGSLKDVERELDFAHTIFQRLKLVSQAADPNCSTTLDAKVVSQAFKPKAQFRPKVGTIIAGMCLAMFGGLGLLGAVKLQQKMAEENSVENIEFEEIEAQVVKRGITRGKENADGTKSKKARPWIAYSYKVYGESFKTKEKLCDEFLNASDAKKMALAYKKGKTIKVWIDPANPESSALDAMILENRPRKPLSVEPEQDMRGMMAFGSLITLGGLGLVAFGFLSGRQKAVAPEFAKTPTVAANQNIDSLPATTDTDSVSQLASAQYFQQQPTGILD